jgi:hypothetical protein
MTDREQKPVAWWDGKESVVFSHDVIYMPNWTDYWTNPLYVIPPKREWVGLTDEEVQEIMEKTVASCTELDDITGDTARFTWRNIEAKLKEKNA